MDINSHLNILKFEDLKLEFKYLNMAFVLTTFQVILLLECYDIIITLLLLSLPLLLLY